MAKFKIGDRVRVVEIDGECGAWISSLVGVHGTVTEISSVPDVEFDDGRKDWGGEEYLELVEPYAESTSVSLSAELTHITVGGKRFRLVAEN